MRPTLVRAVLLALPLLLAVGIRPARAQERPRVFFDCSGPRCDDEYYRTEIPWVDWVRDRRDSDVHVIVTSQSTGAGGRAYQMDFLGQGATADRYEQRLVHRSLPTETDREVLDAIAQTLALGLAHFASVSGYPARVEIRGTPDAIDPADRVVAANEVEDPWDLWVFRINANGNVDGEETRETVRLNTWLSADRVTPTWKIDLGGRVNFTRQEFERSDSTLFVDARTDWGLDAAVVYALADHWSVGARLSSGRLHRFNQDFRIELQPGIEYSYFPYEEATRRSLTASYRVGPAYRNYMEETIFEEMEETRFEQAVAVEFAQRQPWGDASATLEGSHFLHDLSKRRLSLRGDLSVRVLRGLSVNASGNVAWVDDQIYLSAGGETDEEILLRLRQRGTDFEYGVSFGFGFQFGSIYNNVVNNRFE